MDRTCISPDMHQDGYLVNIPCDIFLIGELHRETHPKDLFIQIQEACDSSFH